MATAPMRLSNELRVGIMFLTGLILFVLLIVTLTRWGEGRNTYVFTISFKQAQGLQEGAAVRVAGVEKGRVLSVSLEPVTNKALVNVQVNKDVVLYTGYAYTIGIGGLVGQRFVEIRPTPEPSGEQVRPGDEIAGLSQADMNDLIVNANDLLNKLSVTAQSVNTTIANEENQRNFRMALANLNRTTASAAQFTDSLNMMVRRNQAAIDLMVANLQDVSSDLKYVSDTLSPQLANTDIIRNLEHASAKTAQIADRLESTAQTIELLVSDKEVAADIRSTVHNLNTASASMNTLADDVRCVITPMQKAAGNVLLASEDLPAITGPFREVAPETAENIRQFSVELREAGEKVNATAGKVAGAGTQLRAIKIEPQLSAMILPSADNHLRVDLNVDAIKRDTMLRVGVTDIGQDNNLNLQLGNRFKQQGWLRYGVVESKLGIGVDYRANDNLRFTGELFDPENARVNALADFRLRSLGEQWWLTTGVYGLFGPNQWGVGVTYRP